MRLSHDARRAVDLVRQVADRRRAAHAWRGLASERAVPDRVTLEAVVYFADPPVNLYQMRQWYEPLRRLAEQHPVAVITRTIESAVALARECPLPVVHARTIADIETLVDDNDLTAVFYVNQNTRNFQMLRFRRPAHVFLSHGESDKDYMASNQLKAYDYTFIAGDAARARLTGKLVGFDVESRTLEIGRPQLDVHHEPPAPLPADDRRVVLYAPTWEGDRPSMTYSSLGSHGTAMVQALLATGRDRVIYRPHPRTGIADPRFRRAHDQVVQLLRDASHADPAAGHLVDTESAFGWQLDAADACIADISAVAFDWLATGKALVLTEPASPDAHTDGDGIAATLPTVTQDRAADVPMLLTDADGEEERATRARLVHHYFGDTTPGASMARWLAAAERVMAERAGL
ncbi:CDP-glycerol glycerophosphotransferase family protein [Demequina sp. SYSU T00068]|uniref:CDP-glycerol glycerophosphotransferase family protein n=1 Tax=Demequina lignilytica TaxID=3051663 RepID=UPI00261AFCD2|nr:CDP-glycerol glycerophosphotransferase family protein [Demequina sp. SYSU T00068]MDN4490820.1 CDP-glycerol glycerophosphotransferase family protein [Demequina sp. SYSU T00068]